MLDTVFWFNSANISHCNNHCLYMNDKPSCYENLVSNVQSLSCWIPCCDYFLFLCLSMFRCKFRKYCAHIHRIIPSHSCRTSLFPYPRIYRYRLRSHNLLWKTYSFNDDNAWTSITLLKCLYTCTNQYYSKMNFVLESWFPLNLIMSTYLFKIEFLKTPSHVPLAFFSSKPNTCKIFIYTMIRFD